MEALELVAGAPRGLAVAELSAAMGVTRSAASRILSSLIDQRYVSHDQSSGRHMLSMRLHALALRSASKIGFATICRPVLQAATEETGELTQISAVRDAQLILLTSSQVEHRLAVMPEVGMVHQPHATSSGKIWLASMTNEQAAETALRHGLNKRTDKTITDLEQLSAELDRIRAEGFGIIEDEYEEGVSAIAVAIRQRPTGDTVGTVGTVALSAPSSRMTRDALVGFAPPCDARRTRWRSSGPSQACADRGRTH